MNFFKQIQRIKDVHKMILSEKTGTPNEFAKTLSTSRSQLYNIIDQLKEIDAPIKYSKKNSTFYYDKVFDMELSYSMKVITEDEAKEIFAGFYLRPLLLDGSKIYLQ